MDKEMNEVDNENQDEELSQDYSEQVRERLCHWLAKKDWTIEELLDWLQGYELPPVGHDEEPFVWIRRGLPLADKRYEAETELTHRLAKLLEEKPDISRPGVQPDEVLYNLFMLCAGLNYPSILGEPLYAVFERCALEDVELRDALQSALITNQVDRRLQPVWEDMINRNGHDFLPGDELDGLEGIGWMSESPDKIDEPVMDAIGEALKTMARYLEEDRDRRIEFRQFIQKAFQPYLEEPFWKYELILQAHKNRWHMWAIECLPELYIPFESLPIWHSEAIVWHYILACVPETYQYQVISEFCDGQVLRVRMSEEAANFVHFIAASFEQARIWNPFPSNRSVIGVVALAMSELEVWATMQCDRDIAQQINKARRRLLGRAGVEPNMGALREAIQEIIANPESPQNQEGKVRVLVRATKGIYPNLNLEEEANKNQWTLEEIALLKKAA